ncbi:MAG TPA: hypothetical protein VJL29_04770 [Thermoguttaceae bacterium]|nr:hypothetical protein [Thermoguttaceae bacterium]
MTEDPRTNFLPEGFYEEFGVAWTNDARWKVVSRYFQVKPVASNHDIRPGMLYFVCAEDSDVLRSGGDRPNDDPVPMTNALTGQLLTPLPRKMLFELGKKSQAFKLTPRAAAPRPVAPASTESDLEPEDVASRETDVPEDPSAKPAVASTIEMGSFTQLLTAAQNCGIVPGADQIGHVRDCEYRAGSYQIAFEGIERLYVGFKQAADARVQRLRREEVDYKSGVLKMSVKEWQKKKHRDIVQTNLIERASRHFVRVLDGLRTLMLSR